MPLHIDNMTDRARSSELSGGEGFTLEDAVVAYYLTALLREEAAAVRVAVQQSPQGEPLDDVVVDAELNNEPRRLSLQVKRQLTISAAASNRDFRSIISAARETRAKADFRVGVDRYGFIARSVGDDRLNSLKRIISGAQASAVGADFEARFKPAAASEADIALRTELAALIGAADTEVERDFYAHFVALRLDGFDEGGDRLADMVNRLGELTVGLQGGPGFAKVLRRLAREGAGAAQVWSRPSLLSSLRPLLQLRAAPAFAADIAILTELARASAAEIRQDIGGVEIARDGLVELAAASASKFKFVNISGLPGCGKSVVLRRLVECAMRAGPVLFLKSDRVDVSSWLAFATQVGLEHRTPAGLLAEIGAAGTPTLFIDGIDRIKPSARAIVTDLLTTIEQTPALADWRVIASSRDQGLEPFRQWVPGSFYKPTGIGDVPVDLLDDEEAEGLANARPHLRPLLFAEGGARDIARRPFFAAVLSDQFGGANADAVPPQSEGELIAAWWRAGGYNADAEAIPLRQRALIDLAEAGAASLGKAIAARRLSAATIAQTAALKHDRIIEIVEEGSVYPFAHDIFFEWSFFRSLIDQGDAWPEAVVAAGEPPLLARVVSLLSQHVFETRDDWAAQAALLQAPKLRPQWRRAWLLGPPSSARFFERLASFEALLFADDSTMLHRFLVWFQAERTIPNPLLLNNPNPQLDGAALMRAADQFGWPSDVPLWRRVLTWILAREPDMPAAAIVRAVDLIAVYQNMAADFANPLSERLIAAAENWLIELEKVRVFVGNKSTEPMRWDDLSDTGRGALRKALRQIILRSARAYPEPARRIVQRAIADTDYRSQQRFEEVVLFSPILTQVWPEELAELVRAQVYQELPRDAMEREEREREEHFEILRSIRAKPAAERTDAERRMIESPSLFIAQGSTSYDYDDLGIDHHHSWFFPPTPQHEPFASLFNFAPDIARALVRDIANRATAGWRQVHEIDPEHFGTPLPIDVAFPWRPQRFWGDMRTYAWFLGEGGPQPLEAAFLALTHWAHKRLDAGDDPDAVIKDVVEGHENWTVLGLASSLAIESGQVSATTLPLVACQRLWHADMARQVQRPGRPVTVMGMNPRAQMTGEQNKAVDYLQARRFQGASIRDLAPTFAIGPDKELRAAIKKALARFPDDLPFTYAEEAGNAERAARLRESATIWAAWGDEDNYSVSEPADTEGAAEVTFEAPEPPSPEFVRKQADSARAIAEFNVIYWADQSLEKGAVDLLYEIKSVIAFVQKLDNPHRFEVVEEAGEGAAQTAIAAAAAAVACFSTDETDIAWAWSVLDRAAGAREEASVFDHSRNPMDPRLYLIRAIWHCIRHNRKRPEFGERLLTLAADANIFIAQTAFAALLRQKEDAKLARVAAAMATELFVPPPADLGADGKRDRTAQNAHRAGARDAAIARLSSADVAAPFLAPPPAWVHAPSRRPRWDGAPAAAEWRHPDNDFFAHFAASVLGEFPVETWLDAPRDRDDFLTYLDQLVAWTKGRLFPEWEEESHRRRRSTDMFEWLSAMADIMARVALRLPSGETITRFIDPLGARKHDDAIGFVANLTRTFVCRGVLDAPSVSDDALAILRHLTQRMLHEQVFERGSCRAGELSGMDLPSMVRSLLFVSVPKADGAARFANGDWSELARVMPVVDEVMSVGWATYVMDTYLTLCESADASFPIGAFTRHVTASIDAQDEASQAWFESAIPARIAGVVQRLADAHYPLPHADARDLLGILDRLVDMGDRRAAALQQSEAFRGIQLTR